ncbi:methylase [Philodulcilactobacillus myokoensis]|uniref:Methylase n=1 Tax=Philodulcilactobacillus myokoensis TaxID=2929573 RepID=A0A9W6B2Q6_9LACO|nr:16S rRNA (guanine(966)-N(2))-methyltransferase RsmD [Philodulcilactobacillus myokoensis]GLB46994.1 methylase [Philodulcilactobacillus myokoensis]
MRVISGQFGSRRLTPVPTNKTRPTTDKVKEALFNMIGPYFQNGQFLDLYAGSGGVGIEAISRGMSKAFLVDKQMAAIRTIRANVQMTKHPEQFKILKMDANQALDEFENEKIKFNFVYLDPPYKKQKMVQQLNKLNNKKLLLSNALVICETDNHVELSDNIDSYQLIQQKNYGLTVISIYKYVGDK